MGKSELRIVLMKSGMEVKDVEDIFKVVDKNHDGRISYTEFCEWLFGTDKDNEKLSQGVYKSSKDEKKKLEETVKEAAHGIHEAHFRVLPDSPAEALDEFLETVMNRCAEPFKFT